MKPVGEIKEGAYFTEKQMNNWEEKEMEKYRDKFEHKFYSQNNEEFFIVNYLNGFIGTFLDIGANLITSNTQRLAELGWSGVCVDASPIAYQKLVEHYKGNDKVRCLNCAVMPKTERVKFWDSNGDGISTTSEKQMNEWKQNPNVDYKEIEVMGFSVSDFFSKAGYDFDFISIDVEGINWEIFSRLPFEKLNNLKMICVEHAGMCDLMTKKINQYGFKEIKQARNPENMIFVLNREEI
jgi:FkbM family methyltransferase